MNALFNQDARQGRLHVALGPDALALARFSGTDALNDDFDYRVEAVADRPDLSLDALLGTYASVELRYAWGGARWFGGFVVQAAWTGAGMEGHRYELLLRPWLWLAGQRRNQRIFHARTVVEVLEEVFAPYAHLGRPALVKRLRGDYAPMEYCVQYRESDAEFARRLMERHGITHHFEHGEGAHALILTDVVEEHGPLPGEARPFRANGGPQRTDEEHLWDWRAGGTLGTGSVRLTDYNFKSPQSAMEAEALGEARHENGQIESFDYPGGYLDLGEGRAVAALRLRQSQASSVWHWASGNCAGLGSGLTIAVEGDAMPHSHGARYLCLQATHAFAAQSYASGGGGAEGFSGAYVLAPIEAPLAPVRRQRAPVIPGPQTALVVGSGEVDCDEHGRILVRFHWDLAGANSMRCRVAQAWAAQGWGAMVVPRVGMEVVVEFEDGDPDRPLVTGCVFNGRNRPPYPLPAHRAKSVLRSDTVGGPGYNEVTLEDEKGRENLFLHAQRALTQKVGQDSTARVGRHDVRSVGGNRATETGGAEKHEVGKSFGLVVGGVGLDAGRAADGVRSLGARTAELLDQAIAAAGGGRIGGFGRALADTALGFLTGEGLRAREDVAEGPSPRGDAGAALAGAGGGMAEALSKLFDPEDGVMNVVVSRLKSESVGTALALQVGAARATHVGGADVTHVGKVKKLTVGEELVVEVGKSRLVMRRDGTVMLEGVHFNFTASGPVQINGAVIDLNKPVG